VNVRDCGALDMCLAQDEVDGRMEGHRKGGGIVEQSEFEENVESVEIQRDSNDEL